MFSSGGLAQGGALDFPEGSVGYNNITTVGSVALTGDTFSDNQVIGGEGQGGVGGVAIGGGLNIGLSGSPQPAATIVRTSITGNLAQSGGDTTGFSEGYGMGGGLNLSGSGSVAFTNSSVANNQAIGNDYGAGYGGGFDNTGNTVTLTNTPVTNNQAMGGNGENGGSGSIREPGCIGLRRRHLEFQPAHPHQLAGQRQRGDRRCRGRGRHGVRRGFGRLGPGRRDLHRRQRPDPHRLGGHRRPGDRRRGGCG